MGEQNSPFGRRPREDVRVGSRTQSNVLNLHDVQTGLSAVQAAQDVAVGVLIAGQLEHAPAPWPSRGLAESREGCPGGPGTPRSSAGSLRPPRRIGEGNLRTGRGSPGSG